MKLADEESYKPTPIELLIGAGLIFEIIGSNQIKLRKYKHGVQETKYDWIVMFTFLLL